MNWERVRSEEGLLKQKWAALTDDDLLLSTLDLDRKHLGVTHLSAS